MSSMADTKQRRIALAVPALLLIMGLTCIFSLRVKSPTVDEFAHLPAGYYYWKTGDFSLYGKNPPLVRMLCALPLLAMDISMDPKRSYAGKGDWRPWMFGTYFMEENAGSYEKIFLMGRLPVVVLGLLLGFHVFLWSRDLFGLKGGILSLTLYAFSPNVLAHARLVTTDIGSTCFMFMAVYYYWKSFHHKKGWVGAGVCLGLALLCKFTALLLLPIFGLLLLVAVWLETGGGDPEVAVKVGSQGSAFLKRFMDGALRLVLIVVTALFIVNLGYGFQGSLKSLGSAPRHSELFQALDCFPLNKIPIPLPSAYVEGLDRQKVDAEKGEFVNYLRGEFSRKGWWYYFIYAFLVKTPIPLHIGILASIWYACRRRREGRGLSFLVLPVAVIVSVLSFFNELNIGLRYMLPAFPFLFVWLGQLVHFPVRKTVLRWVSVALLGGYVLSSVSIFPDYLAYFNAWAGGPKNGHRHLLDSNLDWGQDLKGLKGYMEREGIDEVGLAYFGHVDPGIYSIPYHVIGERPESGHIAISANFLYGLPYLITYGPKPTLIKPGTFRWLHGHEPDARIGNSIMVFSIPPTKP